MVWRLLDGTDGAGQGETKAAAVMVALMSRNLGFAAQMPAPAYRGPGGEILVCKLTQATQSLRKVVAAADTRPAEFPLPLCVLETRHIFLQIAWPPRCCRENKGGGQIRSKCMLEIMGTKMEWCLERW